MIAAVCIVLAAVVSALLYARKRRWPDAALVLTAGCALAMLGFNDIVPPATQQDVRAGVGSGATAAAPEPGDAVRVEFASEAAVGRPFRLRVLRAAAAPAALQLLAENGRVLAEAKGTSRQLAVEWVPPLAEPLLLTARLLDAQGKVIESGPVPVTVHDAAVLHVAGRFSAPSFDIRALSDLLTRSGAVLDWQTTLGKTVMRTETPREPIAAPDLLVTDAAWLEKAPAIERTRILDATAAGRPLLILGATARDAAFWKREVGLSVVPGSGTVGEQLALTAPALVPRPDSNWAVHAARAGGGSGTASTGNGSGAGIATRGWKAGRIAWLGAADWHRYAVTEPRALGDWWQSVIDASGVHREQAITWLQPRTLPLPNQRMEICANGVTGSANIPQLRQTRSWQRRAEYPDASCIAIWPRQPGWLTVEAQHGKASTRYYVYGSRDWPHWQATQRHDAQAYDALRTRSATAKEKGQPFPVWPFALVFMAAAFTLWWRERR